MCERRRGRRRGAREGACTGAATMPQLWILRLILNAAVWSFFKQNMFIHVIILGRFASPPTQELDTWDNPARTPRNHHRRRHDRTVSSPWLVLCHSIPHTLASAGLREAEAEAGKRGPPGEAEVLKASCLVLSPHPPENVQFHTVSPPAPLAAVARRAFQKVRDHTHLPR